MERDHQEALDVSGRITLKKIIIIIIIIFIYLKCKWVFTRWQWYYNKTHHTNTYITQNNTTHSEKNRSQSYMINKGHIARNEYNAKEKEKSIAIPARGFGGR
jgi:uncharacterized protein YxeA